MEHFPSLLGVAYPRMSIFFPAFMEWITSSRPDQMPALFVSNDTSRSTVSFLCLHASYLYYGSITTARSLSAFTHDATVDPEADPFHLAHQWW